MTLRGKLIRLGACEGALMWVGDRDLPTAWADCYRADWMLWLCGRMIGEPGWPSHQDVVLAACACVRRALQYVPLGERPLAAPDTIESVGSWAYAVADAARAEAAAAIADTARTDAAYAAYAANGVAVAAKAIAYAAARAVRAAAAADADAVRAAVRDVAAAVATAAEVAPGIGMADVLRQTLSIPEDLAVETGLS